MVHFIDTQLDSVFSALSDPTRRAILVTLLEGEARLTDFKAPHKMSLTAISKHVKVLAKAGLITHEKRGRERFCKLDSKAVEHVSAWLHQYLHYWQRKLDHLDANLTATKIQEALRKHRDAEALQKRRY